MGVEFSDASISSRQKNPPPKQKAPRNTWDESYLELKEFREANGHCRVPTTHHLYSWLCKQHRILKEGNPMIKCETKRLSRKGKLESQGVAFPSESTSCGQEHPSPGVEARGRKRGLDSSDGEQKIQEIMKPIPRGLYLSFHQGTRQR